MAHDLESILAACPELGALTNYFEAMAVEDLARFWPVCLAESLSVEWGILPEGMIGNVTRAAIVVARRLNGVTYMTTVEVGSSKAKSLIRDGKPAEESDAAFTIDEGPMPVAAKGMRADPLVVALETLKAGKHMTIRSDKIRKATLTSKLVRARKVNPKLSMYTAEDGRFIVYVGA